jgi:hypothetical protein
MLVRPREEVQAIRQFDRAVLARDDDPRAIRIVLGDRKAVLAQRAEPMFASSRALIGAFSWAGLDSTHPLG